MQVLIKNVYKIQDASTCGKWTKQIQILSSFWIVTNTSTRLALI